jgi:hypothetical protein
MCDFSLKIGKAVNLKLFELSAVRRLESLQRALPPNPKGYHRRRRAKVNQRPLPRFLQKLPQR